VYGKGSYVDIGYKVMGLTMVPLMSQHPLLAWVIKQLIFIPLTKLAKGENSNVLCAYAWVWEKIWSFIGKRASQNFAAIAVASELGIEDAAIQRALAAFPGIERRLQHIADVVTAVGTITVIDDYGHHPTEVAATLEAVRHGYPGRRVLLAFQPHRFTRTRDLIDDFGKELSSADVLLVTEIYAAGEAPIAGADGRAICRAVRGRGQLEPLFVEKVEELAAALKDVIKDGDVLIAMGAGNISAVAHALAEDLPALLPPGRAS
jgi:UDP-N-acetylmuramate--alanine ligase